jgi:regulator of replication initiation timing
MDAASIAKNLVGMQKQSFNSMMEATVLFQNQAERTRRLLANQMGSNEKAQAFADQWRTVFKNGRDDFSKLINEGYTCMEDYFAGLELKQPSKK